MNIFLEYEDIFGRAETAFMNRTLGKLWTLCGSIRRRLSNKGYPLDQYLSMLLEGVDATQLSAVAEEGLHVMGELRRLCCLVLEGKDDPEEHPMFNTVREYIHSHPLPYQEKFTKLGLYSAALAGEFTEYEAKEYRHTLKETNRVCYDIVELRDLYREISTTLGSEMDMEKLNLLFRQRFLAVPAMAGYLQGIAGDLAGILINRDPETNKLIFQL